MSPEDVRFSSGGWPLAGRPFSGPPPGGPRPAIVVCNGFGGTMADKEPVARAFVEAGRLRPSGVGESDGPPGSIVPLEQVDDVRNAMSILETCPDVAGGAFGLLGVNFRGGTATYAAAVDDLRATVRFPGEGDGGRWLRGIRAEWDWAGFRSAWPRTGRVAGAEGRRGYPLPGRHGGQPRAPGAPGAERRRADHPAGLCRGGHPGKEARRVAGATHYRAHEAFASQVESHPLDRFDRYLRGGEQAEIREEPGRPWSGEEERG
jgi:hypothetical protein